MSTLSPVQTRALTSNLPRPARELSSEPSQVEMTTPTATSSASRTLALVIEDLSTESLALRGGPLAEVLLRFSPRIAMRTEGVKIWFFLDLGSHQPWIERCFGDEHHLVEDVLKTMRSLGYQPRIAIADTPQAAQAFAAHYAYWISPTGRTRDDLDRLPLTSLLNLEGLEAWPSPSRIEAIANFFALLGFQTLGDLKSFSDSSFHERWGELGEKVHLRLQGLGTKDFQPISPFLPTDALKSFVHLDYPVSVVSLLLHEVESAMKKLFARLEGRRLVVRRLRVCLRCEYSNHEHVFSIEPSEPTRDLRFFRLLLENRLERIELLNPIQDLELEIDPLPENERQEGFDNQATLDQTKLSVLTSLLSQEGAKAGFASLQDDVWPENTWIVNPEASRATPLAQPLLEASGVILPKGTAQGELNKWRAQGELDDTGFAPKFHYSAALEKAPRPALLLKKPRPMEPREVAQLQFYSRNAIERIEHSWWEGRAGPPGTPTPGKLRDYYIARDTHGRVLWLYRENDDSQFFLHGAFD